MMIDIDLLLAWGAAYKKVSAGEMIFREGGNCSFYYQLVSGKVRWVNINDEGREFIQTIIEPGECFGELPLFDDEAYAASAIADEDSVIIRLHKITFLQLIKENPEIHFAFSKLLTQRLRFKFLVLKELATHNPESSISTLLSYFKEHKKNICTKCNRLKLTRQQIADMTGLRVETVIRTMRNMHSMGLLRIDKGKVYC
ncbi:MAG TPA: Crp/Fnr family transcriptional regulator [Ferruginibacter sp.]|jgi:CRP-like cAMP-binding protein|nr:Crp/Fnr family transcriptional regulator [Ferruginibacter sp.]HNG63099.1 Crp/Fnr family transcriptional regulator [Ferruginibacter sp.]HNH20817.1 Crp/Fnr family transcriptional regulator [Ferruginibacter sp.]HNJ93210.1 Crp/Fnr family transcriptional regulator [Ferruginibacter sp.]HNK29863.1 Crp/Fnr family transcriptional regulator [Ferruginibacter sp.]